MIFLNKSKVLSYRYCKLCGRELVTIKDELQYDRDLGIVLKVRVTHRCPKYYEYLDVGNGHDSWDWVERVNNETSL